MPSMVSAGTVIEGWGGSVLAASTEFEIQFQVSGLIVGSLWDLSPFNK